MNLSTPVIIKKSAFSIAHHRPVFLIGSCFTTHIGNKLTDSKLDAFINPTGIVFNPISVVGALKSVFNQQAFTGSHLNHHQDKWFSFQHHSSFSSFNKEACLTKINTKINAAHLHLKKSHTIFITLGSAWVYEYKDVGIVANCHKIPHQQFTKRLLSVKEILSAFSTIQTLLKPYNVVFTVSPVRHIKEGLHENNLSKSTLLLAINNLVEQQHNYHYFPAYELIIDELRDYRFYKDDMVHPTHLAVDFVWEKLMDCYFEEATKELVATLQKIKLAVNHIPFNFESEAHQQFVKKQVNLMNDLSKKYDFLDFEAEIKQINTPK